MLTRERLYWIGLAKVCADFCAGVEDGFWTPPGVPYWEPTALNWED